MTGVTPASTALLTDRYELTMIDAALANGTAHRRSVFEVFARRHNLTGYLARHTHRNRRMHIAEAGGAPFVEVACVKDFPGAVAEYRIHDGGIVQVFRRISEPEALRWSERTRKMYEGGYGAYAFGRLADRCFTMADRRARTAVAT